MESIDKLRKLPYHGTNGFGSCVTASKETIDSIADEIEAEISERYMPLPLDADGEVIRFGDELNQFGKPMTVYAITDPQDPADCMILLIAGDVGEHETWVRARKMCHVKPRTIEDVLDDYRRELVETWACTLDDEMTDAEDEITARYADEIRGMQ